MLLVKIVWTGSQDLIYVTGKNLVNWRPTVAVYKRPEPTTKEEWAPSNFLTNY